MASSDHESIASMSFFLPPVNSGIWPKALAKLSTQMRIAWVKPATCNLMHANPSKSKPMCHLPPSAEIAGSHELLQGLQLVFALDCHDELLRLEVHGCAPPRHKLAKHGLQRGSPDLEDLGDLGTIGPHAHALPGLAGILVGACEVGHEAGVLALEVDVLLHLREHVRALHHVRAGEQLRVHVVHAVDAVELADLSGHSLKSTSKQRSAETEKVGLATNCFPNGARVAARARTSSTCCLRSCCCCCFGCCYCCC